MEQLAIQEVAPVLQNEQQLLQELNQNLFRLPKEIFNKNAALYEAINALQTAEEAMKIAESNILSTVTAEVDNSTNKPKFSNESTRNTEVLRRKQIDPAFTSSKNVVDKAKERVAELRLQASLLSDTFSATKHWTILYAAYMNGKNSVV